MSASNASPKAIFWITIAALAAGCSASGDGADIVGSSSDGTTGNTSSTVSTGTSAGATTGASGATGTGGAESTSSGTNDGAGGSASTTSGNSGSTGIGTNSSTTSSTGGSSSTGGGRDAGATGSSTTGTSGPPDGGSGSTGTTGGGGRDGGSTGTGTTGGSTSLPFSYWLGVDISFPETQPVQTRANLLDVLKQHGINSVRLRTFVDPTAADGYNKSGACDLAHTIDFGKQIKAAGMGFLVDFHYSDNWADPGKQCVPIKWQSYTTIDQLAKAVHDYTKDAITQLIAGGARPDMVQIGNETTPGMLIHRCDSGGSPTGNNPVTGSTSNWANLGALLKAGVDGVKEVDPKILTSFHIAKGGDHTDGKSALSTSVSWLTNALKYTSVDAFGESTYATYQGASGSASQSKMIWTTVESGLASKFPNIKFFAAEYGGFEREVNDVFYNLPNQQGLGTFFWEATMSSSSWNTGALVNQSGSTYTATSQLVPQYDQMKMDYASRL